MDLTGIISEYDPFHNGHMLHLRETIRMAGSRVVCCMSGPFTQRGEPSLFSKRARTEMALRNGISVVIELPVSFSCAAAPVFAMGGISILDAIGVKTVSFGAEDTNIRRLTAAAELLANEPDSYKEALHKYLKSGCSFAKARQEALMLHGIPEDTIRLPNNILAVEYIKSLIMLSSNIKPIAIKRSGPGHNSSGVISRTSSLVSSSQFSSASYIRNIIRNNCLKRNENAEPESLNDLSPLESWEIQSSQIALNRLGPTLDAFSSFYHYTCIMEKFKRIMPKTANYQRFLEKSSKGWPLISEIEEKASGKTYTRSRARRAVVRKILGLGPEEETGKAAYARILGFRRSDADIVSYICKNSRIPVITNLTPENINIISQDMIAQELYCFGSENEMAQPIIIV